MVFGSLSRSAAFFYAFSTHRCPFELIFGHSTGIGFIFDIFDENNFSRYFHHENHVFQLDENRKLKKTVEIGQISKISDFTKVKNIFLLMKLFFLRKH